NARGSGHYRCQKLLHRNCRRCHPTDQKVPEVCSGRPAITCSRLRTEPDSALGGTAETQEHGEWRTNHAGNAMSLIPALKKDEELIREMDSFLEAPGFCLWWLGQSGYLLQWNGRRVLIDPYLSD